MCLSIPSVADKNLICMHSLEQTQIYATPFFPRTGRLSYSDAHAYPQTNTYSVHYKDMVMFQRQSHFLNYALYLQFISLVMDSDVHVWVVTKDFDGFILLTYMVPALLTNLY